MDGVLGNVYVANLLDNSDLEADLSESDEYFDI